MTGKSDTTNIWFAVSLGLMGFIIGFATARFTDGKLPSNTVPNAPVADQAAADGEESTTQKIMNIAVTLGLDEREFTECLQSGKFDAKIQAEADAGSKAGISGTPGNILLDLKTGTARDIGGAQPYESFEKNIKEMLADPTSKPSDSSVAMITLPIPPVKIGTDHIRGNTSASLAIIEYSDMECPFCQMVHPTQQQIQQNYGEQVMWVYRHFPLPGHGGALPLARGAECAQEVGGSQEYFWKFVDAVFAEGE